MEHHYQGCGCREPGHACDLHVLVYEAAESISSQGPIGRAGGRGSAACGRPLTQRPVRTMSTVMLDELMTRHRSRVVQFVIDVDDRPRPWVAFWSAALDATEEPLSEKAAPSTDSSDSQTLRSACSCNASTGVPQLRRGKSQRIQGLSCGNSAEPSGGRISANSTGSPPPAPEPAACGVPKVSLSL
jgi:hypothetical protein